MVDDGIRVLEGKNFGEMKKVNVCLPPPAQTHTPALI